ncbi:MAG: hypothetical protein COA78_22600 [Blastopirellula sp.]|nr:MAG: hypothetical protein COA78_22600 [Blastopirellula sp.]
MQEKKNHTLIYGLLFGLLIGTVALGGVFVGWSLNQSQSTLELPIQATASSTSDSMAIATGPISDGIEGLYTLDFLTGNLQCKVLNSRSGNFAATFGRNVLADLALDGTKKPNFLMVTGLANFASSGSNTRPANSVVYVVDTNSGKFACYGIPWQRAIEARGQTQGGTFALIDVGTARNVMLRE